MSYYELLGFAGLWAASMCLILSKVHSRFEDVWQALSQLEYQKLDKEP